MGDETADRIPPWGTPDSAPGHGGPAYGTPPDAAPAGPPPAGLLAADVVVVAERGGFMAARGYDLFDEAGTHLASLTEQTGTAGRLFGGAVSSDFRLVDPQGRLIGVVHRPGSLVGGFEFIVEDAHGGSAGRVQQEHSWSTPRLTLYPADGPAMELRGTGWVVSSDWELVDVADESVVLGSVSTEYAGLGAMLGGRSQFAVRLSPQLRGSARLVAVLTAACLDYIADAKNRSDG